VSKRTPAANYLFVIPCSLILLKSASSRITEENRNLTDDFSFTDVACQLIEKMSVRCSN